MASFAIRKAWFTWPLGGTHGGPANAVAASNAAAVVTIRFSEALRTSTQPTLAQFAATVAGAARTINSVVAAGNTLTVTLASAPTAGQAVVVTYTQGVAGNGRLASASGEELQSQTLASFAAA